MPKSRIYLAYGSNLNLAQMARRCPTAKRIGAAELKGYELLFRGKPSRGAVATIEPRTGATVPVLLWRLRPADEAALDRYEGVPNTYAKQMLEVEHDGKSIEAMTYVMMPGFRAGQPSLAYYYRIAQGYHSAGFNYGILTAAMTRSEEAMWRESSALGVPQRSRTPTIRGWDKQIGAAGQLMLDDGLFDLGDEVYDDPYLDNLPTAAERNRWELSEDERQFLEDVTQDHPGGPASLDGDQVEHLLCFYSDYQFGDIDQSELERQCREYLEGLDEPAPEQNTLFGMKWGW